MNIPPDFSMSADELTDMLINPFYAVQIDPTLTDDHELLVSEEQWITANRKLLRELGEEAYLRRLLTVVKGDSQPSGE
ncbi:MAG: hypothetical protein ACT4RN_01830 [Pseudonocardia sp.]